MMPEPTLPALISLDSLIALITLTCLEIVLGIDNIVFISITSDKLEPALRPKARRTGLALALFGRVLLLLSISWVTKLTNVWFTLAGHGFSGKDIILLTGGLFLVAKSTYEIHEKIEGTASAAHSAIAVKAASFARVIMQILLLDIVFSLDSVITAVGMAEHVEVMITAVVIAMIVMLVFVNKISRFISNHPTMKMLALAFLLLIGVMLMVEGFHKHISKGYIYFAMAFSLFVEMLNMRASRKREQPTCPETNQ